MRPKYTKPNITAEANKKNVNFLDVNLDLNTGLYRPYMKPNDVPTYVHKDSNHPKAILENIPHSVNRRLSTISSNSDVFKQAIPPFQEALKRSGHNYTLHFDPHASRYKLLVLEHWVPGARHPPKFF